MASVGLSCSRLITGLNLPKARESQLSSNLSSPEFPSFKAVKEFRPLKVLEPFGNNLLCRLRGSKRIGTICASIQDHASQFGISLSFSSEQEAMLVADAIPFVVLLG